MVDKYATVLSLGFLIGTGGSLAFVMLTTGIYWGQLSQCTEAPGFDIPYVERTLPLPRLQPLAPWNQPRTKRTHSPRLSLRYYSCENIPAMRGVSTLAILLMVQQLAFR